MRSKHFDKSAAAQRSNGPSERTRAVRQSLTNFYRGKLVVEKFEVPIPPLTASAITPVIVIIVIVISLPGATIATAVVISPFIVIATGDSLNQSAETALPAAGFRFAVTIEDVENFVEHVVGFPRRPRALRPWPHPYG